MIALDDKLSFYLPGTNGKGVLLIHGLTGVPAEMKFVARALNRVGYSVYAPLLAGHGQGIKTLCQSRWQDWLDSVMHAARQLQGEVETVYAAGICVGGKLGMMAANRMPQTIKAAAIYSPCFRYDGWNVPWYYKLAPIGLPFMVHFPWWRYKTYAETDSMGIKNPRLRQFMASAETEDVIDEFPAISLLEMYRLGEATKRALPRMTTPTLILHAEEDDLSHPRNARIIANRIGAQHQLEWIKDSYHMIHVDAQHKFVAQITADFFSEAQHG